MAAYRTPASSFAFVEGTKRSEIEQKFAKIAKVQ